MGVCVLDIYKGGYMNKESPCVNCDHICDTYLNEDHECWGSLTEKQREELNKALSTPKPLPEVKHDAA